MIYASGGQPRLPLLYDESTRTGEEALCGKVEEMKLMDRGEPLKEQQDRVPKQRSGFHGLWRFYNCDGGGGVDDAVTSEFRCIRTYHYTGGATVNDPLEVEFMNFREQDLGRKGATTREADGLLESSYTRTATDSYFSTNMRLDPSEEAMGLPSCAYWRSVPIDDDTIVRLPPALPPTVLQGGVSAVSRDYPAWMPHCPASNAWAFEAFIQDKDARWSMGPLYNVLNLRLRSHFCIREYATTVNTDQAIHLDDQPLPEPRSRLNEDPATWLDNGTWTGMMMEVVWDEDGALLPMRPRAARWSPPDLKQPHYRLERYPDLMYGFWPEQLPMMNPERCKSAACVRFEAGGYMQSHNEFRRVIIRYAPTLEAESITYEVYLPP